jgi:hypothetical protein
MQANATQRQISELEHLFPHYMVWTITRPSGLVWCARRWDGTRAVLNAPTPEALEHHIESDVEELT